MLNTMSDYANLKCASERLYDKAFELSVTEDSRAKWAKIANDASADAILRDIAHNKYIFFSKKAMAIEEEMLYIQADITNMVKR